MTDPDFSSVVSEEALQEFLQEELDYDFDFFSHMFKIFQGFVGDLNELSGSSKRQEVQHLAHKMRSSCKSFGAFALEKKLQEIETEDESSEGLCHAQELAQSTVQAIQIFYDRKLEEAQKSA